MLYPWLAGNGKEKCQKKGRLRLGRCNHGGLTTWRCDHWTCWDESSHRVSGGNAAGGSVFAVVAVLQVDLCLANQVVSADKVPVVHGHGQHGLHGERGLNVERSEGAREEG